MKNTKKQSATSSMCIDLCVVASIRLSLKNANRLQVTSAAHLDAIAWSLEWRKLIRYHRVGFTDGIWCGNIFWGGRTWLSNALLPWCVCLVFVVLFCFSCVVCSVFYVEKTANNKYVDVISQNDFVGCCCMKWWTAGYTRCYFSMVHGNTFTDTLRL